MKSIHRKILKKTLPFILAAIFVLFLGAFLRLGTDSGLFHILGFLLIAIAVMVLTVIGNPIDRFKKQLEGLGYTTDALVTDLEKGVSYENIDLGTQFLISYGVFTKIISFQDVLWTYLDSAFQLHFIMKDNTETTVAVEALEIGKSIAKQMEKGCPWILFGYHEEVAQLREDNFEDLKQLYTRKLFECVVEGKLPENPLYPCNRTKPEDSDKASQKPSVSPYPVLPVIAPQDVKILDNSLSEYFTELVQLCKDYPEDIRIEFHAPAKAKEIASFERRNQLSLPVQLKDLLLISNGFSLDYDDFYSLEQIEYKKR
ncbi:MAG: SMI1/KNR4 family protein [Lachnospiraceae bacterium]|nr:SMI1/KNR4 family protein [Lachnospiraceae bacterium]